MARIIRFPKIHRARKDSGDAPGTSVPPTSGDLALYVLLSPFFVIMTLAIAFWPIVMWLVIADVLVQLVRIIFIGGMSGVYSLLHLAILLAAAGAVAVLALLYGKQSEPTESHH